MTEYKLSFYYKCNGHSCGEISPQRIVSFDGDTRTMLKSVFPQYPKYGWSTYRDDEGYWTIRIGQDHRQGLYVRVEKPYGQSIWPYVRLWRPREWMWSTYYYEDAVKTAKELGWV